MRLLADSRHKKEKGLLHKHSPRPCITTDCSKKLNQRGALWHAGGHWPAPDDQHQAGLHQLRMSGLGSSPGALGCLPRARPPRPVPSTTPAVAQGSLGARRGRPGGRGICGTEARATSLRSLLHRPQQTEAGPRGQARSPGPARAALHGLLSAESGGPFGLINHESSHGSCPLLWPNGSRSLIIELRADTSTFRPFQPQPPAWAWEARWKSGPCGCRATLEHL